MRLKKIGFVLLTALWLCLAVCLWLLPKKEISASERRKLSQLPKFSVQSVASGQYMSGFDSFVSDQFPGRDVFRRIKALFGNKILLEKDNNGIYKAENSLAKLDYPVHSDSVAYAKGRFAEIYRRYLEESERIVFCPVPDKGYYLAEKNGYPTMDYEALFDEFRQLDWAEYADITDLLSAQSYYATDTHWRQEAIYPVAERLADMLGVTLEPPSTISQKTLTDEFYGVYYGQAALPMKPDNLTVCTSEILENCVVTNLETGEILGLYDLSKLEGNDPYEVFLSGSVSLIQIENPAAETDRELIVFRDSFGSSLVPLLSSGYAKITLVDIRYLPTANVGRFLNFHGQDVLFLYSTLVLNNSDTLK